MMVATMMLLSGGHLRSCKKSGAGGGRIILVPANWAIALLCIGTIMTIVRIMKQS